MNNHWTDKKKDQEIVEMIKEGDKLDIAAIRIAMGEKPDDRKILELAFFGKEPENVKYTPFLYAPRQHVQVNVEPEVMTGVVGERYSTNDGLNWYEIELDKIWQGYDRFTFCEFRVSRSDQYNVIPEYIPGRKKRFEHNYNVSVGKENKLTLNSDTFQPQQSLDIKVNLQFDGQHDGHLWDANWKEKCDKRLVEEIMSDLKQKVEEFVAKVNPFSVHC